MVVVGRGGGIARAVALAARDAIRRSFDTKVIGPLMLAKHLAPRMSAGGSFVLFAMTSTFLTGVTLQVDGGEPLT